MKTVFDKATRDNLIRRIQALDDPRSAQWGKMNLFQMVRHCALWEGWIQGKPPREYRQELLGHLFGGMALRNMAKDDKPLARNVPTGRDFKIRETEGDLAAERRRWAEMVAGYEHYSNPGFIHDFFGRMTVEQVGQLAYKHNDHHLRQFGG
jgi:hypothetical protein